MSNQKSATRSMLVSVLMSAPGPLVVGIGLLTGKSSTQLADFFRRSAELLALVCAYIVYRITAGNGNADRRARLERCSNAFVGAMMCLGGAIMILLAITAPSAEKGNVIPGLCIAVMGVIANAIFWRKYTHLNKAEPNAILAVQARLYRAKTLVDLCVTSALLTVVIAPTSPVSAALDTIGSVIVAGYLLVCGAQTVLEAIRKHP